MQDVFGTVTIPGALNKYGGVAAGGPGLLLSTILRLMLIAGGIYALFNFILAGYAFLSAGDDPKQIQGAWAKIWQSVLGLVFMAGSFILAAIFGLLIFGDPGFILRPKLVIP